MGKFNRHHIYNKWNEYEKMLNLLSVRNEPLFDFILKSLSNIEETRLKPYSSYINQMSYIEGHLDIPEKLYKYIDFDAGIMSLQNQNMQFSHPLSFHDLGNSLSDMTEFNLNDRLYIDHISIEQIKQAFASQGKRNVLKSNSEFFTYLVYNFVTSCLERNKIGCLSTNKENEYLWKDKMKGLCIEFDHSLFISADNFEFDNGKKSTILYNKVQYVEEIVKYPIRTDNYEWLSNTIFIKHSVPYKHEEEFRILLTQENTLYETKLSREDRFKVASGRIFNLPSGYNHNTVLRPTFDKKFITKVYYTDQCENLDKLMRTLDELEIVHQKI